MNSRILTLYAETSLHPGTGQTTGVVDLPIQRERHTGFPKIEATGFKQMYSLDFGIQELIKGYTMIRNAKYGNV